MAVTAVDKPAPLDLNSIPTADQLASRRVSATLDGNQLSSSSIENEGRQKIFDKAGKQLGKQDFLNLLVTQLRFQDPLQPTENTEFVAQLAQFSSLEGTQNINTSIEELGKQIAGLVGDQKASATSMSNASATSLIGKNVRVQTESVDFDPAAKDPISISVHSDSGMASVLSIVDEAGEIVNAVPIPKPGENNLAWNGSKMDGTKAKGGKYTLKVTTLDGLTDTGYAYMQDRVAGITYAKDGLRLEVGGQQVGMDKIIHVGDDTVYGD